MHLGRMHSVVVGWSVLRVSVETRWLRVLCLSPSAFLIFCPVPAIILSGNIEVSSYYF